MASTRHLLWEATQKHGWKDRVEHVEGLLTCGIVALANSNEEIVKFEIRKDDTERGQHLLFRTRGIGLDVCPCCFVCGATQRAPGANHYLNNIAAFVASREEGASIVEWFEGKAAMDFREKEPNWIQVKVGACDLHLANLQALDGQTGRYGVIRQRDIADALNTERPSASGAVPGSEI